MKTLGAVIASVLTFLAESMAFAQDEVDADAGFYLGAAGALTLPQGGSTHLRRLGGATLRGGRYLSEYCAIEGEVSWLEDAAGMGVDVLWHWQGAELYGKYFGYSQFDPFFTIGGRGWLGRSVGQVGPQVGTGAFYHLTDSVSLRFDAGATLGLDGEKEADYSISFGVQHFF